MLACMIAAPALCAYGDDARTGLAKLFDLGTNNTPPAVTAARKTAYRLKRANRHDTRIDYAYGVVLANQHRYEDAIRLVNNYLEAQPDDLSAHQVKIWAQLHHKAYADVLASADVLGEQLRAAPDGAPGDEEVEAARFLGVIFGYLELVLSDAVDHDQLAAQKNALLAHLHETHLSAFDQGRELVAEKRAQLEADRDARLQRAEDAIAEKKEQTIAALNDNLDRAADQKETIQSSTQQIRDAHRDLSVIQRQLASLEQDRALLTTQIISVQAQLAQILPPPVDVRPSDPILRNRNSTTPGVLRVEDLTNDPNATMSIDEFARASALSLAIAGLNQQAFDVDRRMFQLRTRAAELAGHGRQRARELAESRQIADTAARQADRLQKQLDRDDAALARSAAGPGRRAARFSTYVPFPYERETQRVLDWFAN